MVRHRGSQRDGSSASLLTAKKVILFELCELALVFAFATHGACGYLETLLLFFLMFSILNLSTDFLQC